MLYALKAVCEELACVVNYYIVMANRLNGDLEDIVLKKLEKKCGNDYIKIAINEFIF